MPTSSPNSQQGAAIIMALFTIALVAMLAAAVLGEFGVALDGYAGLHDQAQARVLARGALDFARNVLADDAKTSSVDHEGEAWAIKVPPTRMEDGEVGGEIQDLSGRFNLNNLVYDTSQDNAEAAAFMRLLALLGVPADEAQALTAALADWQDEDDVPRPGGAESSWYLSLPQPGRAANAPLADVAELSRIRGFTPERIAALRPFVAALPAFNKINVNTAPAEVLAAGIAGLSIDDARLLVARRSGSWFRDLADFASRLPTGARMENARFATGSRYFLATGSARYGVAVVRMDALLDRNQTWPDIIWQKLK